LTTVLNDEDQQTRRYAVVILGQIGEPALDSLAVAIADKDITVKRSVLDALGQIGTPALDLFARIVASDEQARKFAIATLVLDIGAPALPIIKQVLENGSLSDRYHALEAAMRMGRPGLNLVVGSLEDPDGQISEHTIHYFSGPKSGEWNEQFEQMPNIEPDDISQAILNELIIRESDRPEQFFSPRITARSLQVTIERSPRLYNELQTQLCNLVFEGNSALRQRAISVARILGPGDFAAKVKNVGIEQPDVAREVMRTLGGGEAAAYFAEQQNQALDRFRAPLIELEETARQRWEDLTLAGCRKSIV
jgi:hypothetical protein